ncbi:MAG: PP2C family protein-serine/threonine phosphatase [Planctomycetota bacterium]
MGEPVVVAGGHSERGRRDNNEDAHSIRTDLGVFIVADGMGGLAAGEVASRLAVDFIPPKVIERLGRHDRPDEALRTAIESASQAILAKSNSSGESTRMGTTAVVALVRPGRVFVANLGDSPAYLVRGERVIRLTLDHTVAEELVRKGALSPDQARRSPLRNRLYKYLGSPELKELADVHDFPPRPGDRLILMSDGASGLLGEDEIGDIAGMPADPDILAKAFVDMALEKGSHDNATCIVLAFEAGEPTSPPA